MNCIFFNHPIKLITGGHKYNHALLSYLQKDSGTTVITTPRCSEIYPGWRKIYAPFSELKRIKRVGCHDVVFFGDICFKYHLLLLLILRILRRGIPIVIVHHFSYLNDHGIVRYVNYMWQYVFYVLCKYVIVPSPYTRRIAEEHFKKKKVVYIPLPFHHDYCPSTYYEEGNFLYVGTIEPRKGLIYLMEALGIVKQQKPDWHFTLNVVGEMVDRHYADQIISKAEELNIKEHIIMRGRASDDELNDYYQRAEIFTFPSLLEGYGIVLIEAFSKGVPVICFNNSAMPYTVKDGINGLVADNMDAQSLADKIMLLSGNKTLREKLQKGIVKTIESLKTKEDFEAGIRNMFYTVKQAIG